MSPASPAPSRPRARSARRRARIRPRPAARCVAAGSWGRGARSRPSRAPRSPGACRPRRSGLRARASSMKAGVSRIERAPKKPGGRRSSPACSRAGRAASTPPFSTAAAACGRGSRSCRAPMLAAARPADAGGILVRHTADGAVDRAGADAVRAGQLAVRGVAPAGEPGEAAVARLGVVAGVPVDGVDVQVIDDAVALGRHAEAFADRDGAAWRQAGRNGDRAIPAGRPGRLAGSARTARAMLALRQPKLVGASGRSPRRTPDAAT